MGPLIKPSSTSAETFQSTHPVWDGTLYRHDSARADYHFNPPIPCGMGRITDGERPRDAAFQSTHPVWDGTAQLRRARRGRAISIHPSRVGWDPLDTDKKYLSVHFNPPIPCGMGPRQPAHAEKNPRFQSTHPVWDGTTLPSGLLKCALFQSTHPVWDGTYLHHPDPALQEQFQSTHPVWDGTVDPAWLAGYASISIHPSRVGWDSHDKERRFAHGYFNPPIPCGMGLVCKQSVFNIFVISIHPSRVGWDSLSNVSVISCCRFQSTHPVWDGTS